MRQDEEVHQLIQEIKAKERESGCCVRNDRSGCLQTLQEECSVRLTLHSVYCIRLNKDLSLRSNRVKEYVKNKAHFVVVFLFSTAEYIGRVDQVASASQRPVSEW